MSNAKISQARKTQKEKSPKTPGGSGLLVVRPKKQDTDRDPRILPDRIASELLKRNRAIRTLGSEIQIFQGKEAIARSASVLRVRLDMKDIAQKMGLHKRSETSKYAEFSIANPRDEAIADVLCDPEKDFTYPCIIGNKKTKHESFILVCNSPSEFFQRHRIPLSGNQELTTDIIKHHLPTLYPYLIDKDAWKKMAANYPGLALDRMPIIPPYLLYRPRSRSFLVQDTLEHIFQRDLQEAGLIPSNIFNAYETTRPHDIAPFIRLASRNLQAIIGRLYSRWPFLPDTIEPEELDDLMTRAGEKSDEDEGAEIKKERERHLKYDPHTGYFHTTNMGLGATSLMEPLPVFIANDLKERRNIAQSRNLWGTQKLENALQLWTDADNDSRCEILCRLIETTKPEFKSPFIPDPAPGITYDFFQVTGMTHCLTAGPTIMLSDDMGTGKTVQATGVADSIRHKVGIENFSGLFIVPPDTIPKWRKHLINFPSKPFKVLSPREHDWEIFEPNTIYLCSNAIITTMPEILRKKWNVLVVDEGHTFTKSNAQRTSAFYGIDEATGDITPPAADLYIQMTGTDITNTITDYHPIVISILKRGNTGMRIPVISQTIFAEIFSPSRETKDAKNSNEQTSAPGTDPTSDAIRNRRISRLAEALDKGPRIRRLKLHVMPDLPPKHPPKTWIIPVRKEMSACLQEQSQIMEALEKNHDQKERRELAKMLHASRIETARYKVPSIARVIERVASQNDPVLLFGYHTEICNALAEQIDRLNVPLIIAHGKNTSPTQRAQCVQDFEDGKGNVFISAIPALYANHDLTRARRCFFAELDHKNWMIQQAEDRVWRRGQLRDVYIRYFITPGSYDGRIATNIIQKTKTHMLASGDDRRTIEEVHVHD